MARSRPSVLIKSLRPRPMRVAGYRDTILSALWSEGAEMRALLTQATRTWQPPVRFRTDRRVSGDRAEVQVTTKDIRFISVDQGTKTRWAVMSPDFKAKSQIRSLTASAGAGSTVIRGRRAMQQRNIAPRPGIKARNFSVEVRKIRRPKFHANMRKAIKRAAKGTF